MSSELDPYQAYTDGKVFNDHPLNLIVALYEGALDGCCTAEKCLRERDIAGRARGVNKTLSILAELLVCLNHEQGGEISRNLKELYCYMQRRLLEAHARQAVEPIQEVTSLLKTLLDAWQTASQTSAHVQAWNETPIAADALREDAPREYDAHRAAKASQAVPFYGYEDEVSAAYSSRAYSF